MQGGGWSGTFVSGCMIESMLRDGTWLVIYGVRGRTGF